MSHNPPPGPPPNVPNRPQRQDSLDTPAVPDEPPPAYEAVSNSDPTVASGPTRMDFSGPPPLPDRFQRQHQQQHLQQTPTGGQVIPGVGTGYGPGPSNHHGGYTPPPGRPPPPPPRHNATQSSSSTNGDMGPTESPEPGRPLLRGGQLLVYPKGHYCERCGNTGYINSNPSQPCTSDWRKYGKAFSSALAHSYAIAPKRGANMTTVAATNFQRPLPGGPGGQQQNGGFSGGHHAPPPQHQQQGWNSFPGHYRPPPPPMIRPHAYGPPPGALVVQPGDPRIGGQVCYNCGGSGREMGLFFFDDGPCYKCRGVGRLFQ